MVFSSPHAGDVRREMVERPVGPTQETVQAGSLNRPTRCFRPVIRVMFGADVPSDADACGSPPPNFTKAAHQAVIVLARLGDTSGVCNGSSGCANGDYYLFLTEGGSASASDPVIRLQQSYDAWRAGLAGVPDHIQSRVRPATQALVARSMYKFKLSPPQSLTACFG